MPLDMTLDLGSEAPGFTLQNTEGKKVSLGDFSGKRVLLLFFPVAFSGTCTEELCRTRDNMKLFESLDAEVIALSVDSFFALREFKKANNLNFTLLSDFNKKVSQDYDVLYEDFYGMKGVSKRSAFVVDTQGRIRYAEVLEDADQLPDFNAIQQVLQEL